MILRPYKSCDAQEIAKWVNDRDAFMKWGGERFGEYPLRPESVEEKYTRQNGDCPEEDNFYPWMAAEDGKTVGHFIMRYTDGDPRQVRFGWVVVDGSIRGKGYGQQMLALGLRYAFEFLEAERVTIGVFENNEPAHRCYRKAGFTDRETVTSTPWNVIEMEISRTDYRRRE